MVRSEAPSARKNAVNLLAVLVGFERDETGTDEFTVGGGGTGTGGAV
jgi:hypothetical protein